jgi:hypothetical protein
MELATSSLPVPLSPRISTVALLRDTWLIIWKTSRILLLLPMMLLMRYLFSSSSRRRLFSARRASFSRWMVSRLMAWRASMVATTESSLVPFLQRVIRIVGPVHAQGTDHPFALLHRDTDKRDLSHALDPARCRPVEKQGFFTDFGNGHGLTGFDHPADDPLAQLVFHPLHGALGQAVGHLDVDFVSQGVENRNGSALHLHGCGENIQHLVHGFFQIQMLVEGIGYLVKKGDLFNGFHLISFIRLAVCQNGC